MSTVTACKVPEASLLAAYGGAGDYRDCFCREVAGDVSLADFIEHFYCSMAFRPERIILGLLGRGASNADARAMARGEATRIAAWEVIDRTETEILLLSKGTNTASWLSVDPAAAGRTKLMFGSWVGGLDRSGWRFFKRPHRLYSRVLLAGVRV